MTRIELFAASALGGLCAHPHHAADAHPMSGDPAKLAARALELGLALAAAMPEELPAPAPAVEGPAQQQPRKGR